MKGLLQSKIFRKNLGKWLFMYLLCMGVFTTVITYSKYISNLLNQSDEARVSKFNIQLNYCTDESCSDITTQAPRLTTYRPFDEITYYFAIDASNLEVDTDMFVTISLDRHFKIKELKEITDEIENNSNLASENSKIQTVDRKVIAGDKTLIKYMVTIICDEEIIDYNEDGSVKNGIVKEDGLPRYIFDENQEYNILTVGYSAEQSR